VPHGEEGGGGVRPRLTGGTPAGSGLRPTVPRRAARAHAHSDRGRVGTDRCPPSAQCGATVEWVLNRIQNLNGFKLISNPSNFTQFKKDLPLLRKFEIKYGCEGFQERKNFLHRNFFRFKMDFK
jgi:hypothetical protein